MSGGFPPPPLVVGGPRVQDYTFPHPYYTPLPFPFPLPPQQPMMLAPPGPRPFSIKPEIVDDGYPPPWSNPMGRPLIHPVQHPHVAPSLYQQQGFINAYQIPPQPFPPLPPPPMHLLNDQFHLPPYRFHVKSEPTHDGYPSYPAPLPPPQPKRTYNRRQRILRAEPQPQEETGTAIPAENPATTFEKLMEALLIRPDDEGEMIILESLQREYAALHYIPPPQCLGEEEDDAVLHQMTSLPQQQHGEDEDGIQVLLERPSESGPIVVPPWREGRKHRSPSPSPPLPPPLPFFPPPHENRPPSAVETESDAASPEEAREEEEELIVAVDDDHVQEWPEMNEDLASLEGVDLFAMVNEDSPLSSPQEPRAREEGDEEHLAVDDDPVQDWPEMNGDLASLEGVDLLAMVEEDEPLSSPQEPQARESVVPSLLHNDPSLPSFPPLVLLSRLRSPVPVSPPPVKKRRGRPPVISEDERAEFVGGRLSPRAPRPSYFKSARISNAPLVNAALQSLFDAGVDALHKKERNAVMKHLDFKNETSIQNFFTTRRQKKSKETGEGPVGTIYDRVGKEKARKLIKRVLPLCRFT